MTSEPAEDRLHAWVARIPSDACWNDLSELERTILLAYKLELEVANGGLHQYFKNPAGDRWRETAEALQRISATRVLEVFQKALAVFPQQSPSFDHTTRAEQLARIGPDAEERLEQLTDEYYAIYFKNAKEDPYAKMTRFLLQEES